MNSLAFLAFFAVASSVNALRWIKGEKTPNLLDKSSTYVLNHVLNPATIDSSIESYYQPEFAAEARKKLEVVGKGRFGSVEIAFKLPTDVLDHDQARTKNKEGNKNIMTAQDEKCVVYGAGIAGDSAFEESMANKGCEVHAFDCTVSESAPVVKNKHFTFHKVCLGTPASFEDNSYTKGQTNQTYEFKSLSQVMQELGHKKVDVLKFDIEGFEWNLFEKDLLNGLAIPKQISFELHTMGAGRSVPKGVVEGKDDAAVNGLFSKLYDLGYRVISKEMNYKDKMCAEFVVVNINH